MIDIVTKIHDRFSIEFKMGFVTRRKLRRNDFSVYMWIFVPKSLDINPDSYSKADFYQDVKSNVRLITPRFLLREIAGGSATPLLKLRRAFENLALNPTRTMTSEYEYQIKMFAAITKSASREECKHICSGRVLEEDIGWLCSQYVDSCRKILSEYRAARNIINAPGVSDEMMSCWYFGDDFISTIVLSHGVKIIRYLESKDSQKHPEAIEGLYSLVREENGYRTKMDYAVLSEDDPMHNRVMLFRFGALKKYVESDLFVDMPKKKDGALVEQLYFSIAAGMAMMFATVVSFTFQQKFGNFTLPFFIILVISYMIKDRIKELSRFYFAHRIGSRFFDNKAKIRVKDECIGTIKEGMDFIPDSKVPEEVKYVRYHKRLLQVEKRISDDRVILYRKQVHIDRDVLRGLSDYDSNGINDIIRLNVNSFLQKMDNPKVNITSVVGDGTLKTVACDKIYYLNIVLQMNYDESGKGKLDRKNKNLSTEYKRFRVALNRDGIDSIEEVQ